MLNNQINSLNIRVNNYKTTNNVCVGCALHSTGGCCWLFFLVSPNDLRYVFRVLFAFNATTACTRNNIDQREKKRPNNAETTATTTHKKNQQDEKEQKKKRN